MLKNIPNNIKEICKKTEISLNEYIKLNNEIIYTKGTLKDDCYQDGNFIGTFIFKELQFECENIYDFKKKEVEYHKIIDGIDINYGSFIVTEIKDNDTKKTVKVIAMDYGLKSQIAYKSNLNYDSNVTLFDVWQECCDISGLLNGMNSFTNSDFIVDSNQFDNVLVRDVMMAVSQIACGFVKVLNDNKVYIMLQEETNDVIEDYVELEDKRDTQPINSVSLGVSNIEGNNVVRTNNVSDKNWLIINDNPFAYTMQKREQLIDNIYNKINGFSYSSFVSKSSFKPYLTCGDLIRFKNSNGELINSIILRYNHNFEKITLEAPSIIKATVSYKKPTTEKEAIKRTEIVVDQQNQKIESTVEKVDGQDIKISQITQTVDELNSKITDIADITTSAESEYGVVNLVEVNESEPITIKLRPTTIDIERLVPNNYLVPSNSLKPRVNILRFKNTTTNEITDYRLPFDLYFYLKDDGSIVADEFYLNYDSQTCHITKRVNKVDGVKELVDEYVIDIEYPILPLSSGNFEVSLIGYDNAYIYIQLMASNMYTTQFATKVELSSSINQTKDEIGLEVAKKVGNEEIISKINLSPETATIQANKVNINGVVSLINDGTTTIDGSKITTGTITANQVSSEIITTTNFQAQNINADKINAGTLNGSNVNITNLNASNITGGTLSASKINGGSLTASEINLGSGKFKVTTNGALTSTSGKIGGWTIDGTNGIKSGSSSILSNGNLNLFPSAGGRYNINNGVRLNATSGVVISSNGGVTSNFPSKNLDLKACSGAEAYIGCMANADGTTEKSGIICSNGILKFKSTGYCTYNGTTVFGSSSRATKENIIDLKKEQKEEVYDLIKNIPIKQYDYKKEYGKPFNYGFIIEDIEETKLKDLLHITQAENNKDIKMYSTEDLARLELITIQILMNKIEQLEEKINKLEKESDK